mmetsp:Transcript_34116/g.25177  ORF Transcript_34116/g.25177 Transcript_34116/m.25177 type:complete len:186 (-) Transcript_34116:732-1289(-)
MSRTGNVIVAGKDYTIYFTGDPPSKMRMKMTSYISKSVYSIHFQVRQAYKIYVDGVERAAIGWDDTLGAIGPFNSRSRCGDNRYVGQNNTLQILLDATACEARIEEVDAISSMVRLSWTLAEFYADGGTTAFVDRLSSSLGIHASEIKIVSVYEGSVIIEFMYVNSDLKAQSRFTRLFSRLVKKN